MRCRSLALVLYTISTTWPAPIAASGPIDIPQLKWITSWYKLLGRLAAEVATGLLFISEYCRGKLPPDYHLQRV